ncbi:MAG TPA: site-2 protease family protein [Phycisphaerales bacterium]|nr:site-2 protease family protein [Phycisphaerales bacterium]
MGWWVEDAWNNSPVILISWVVWVLLSIVLHELGHGVAAIRAGDRTPIETGHMTWNPVVHIPPMSLLAFALFGFCWGLMPVNPHRFRGRYDEAIVAAAGPAVNAGLFVICIACAVLWSAVGGFAGPNLHDNLFDFFRIGAAINCLGVLFNLIPVPPLDGHRILGDFVPRFRRFWESEQGAMMGLFAFMAIFFFGAQYVWDAVFAVTHTVLDAALGLVGRQLTP